MKTRSSKRVSRSPIKENETEDNEIGLETSGKRQKFGTQVLTKNNSLNSKKCESKRKNGIKLESDSSDSSSDEYLKPPRSFDLDSDFFKIKKEETLTDFATIEKNMFSDIQRLSESENSDLEEPYSFQQNIDSINSMPSTSKNVATDKSTEFKKVKGEKVSNKKRAIKRKENVDKSKVKPHNKLESKSKASVKKNEQSSDTVDTDKMDISQLLAWGEIQKCENQLKPTKLSSCSENEFSDWEEVKGAEDTPIKEHSFPKEGVQVTVQIPDLYQKRKKKGFDMEAYLKRKLNRVKREMQVLIHKVHLLCWIAHGRYVNSLLNSDVLMGLSLSLIPSQHCYPPGRANIKYLEQILKWFNKTVTLNEKDDAEKKPTKSLPICESLQKQFETTTAISKRDLVLMFVCLMRSLGISARLILSLQPVPLKLASDELCSISSNTSKSKSDPSKKQQNNRKKSTQKKESKVVLGVKEAEHSRKRNVISKQEAIERIKETKPNNDKSKVKVSKQKSCKKEGANENLKSDAKSNRSLRVRKEVSNKYKEQSENSDENVSASVSEKNDTKGSSKKINSKEMPKGNKSTTIKTEPNFINGKEEPKSGKCKSDSVVNGNKISKFEMKSKSKGKNISSAMNNSRSKTSQESAESSTDEFIPHPLSSQQAKSVKQSISSKKVSKLNHDSDSDFEPETVTFKNRYNKASNSKSNDLDRRVLSSDSDDADNKKIPTKLGCDVWTEVFVEEEETWISVDVPRGKVHCVKELYSRATKPVTYVVAWNTNLTLKDVTRRYCAKFHTVTRKQRADEAWWKEALFPFSTANTARDREEDEEMDSQLQDRPLPTSVSEFKNHPLYVLPRHLLKFEAIYPPNALSVGFIRGESIYARECVHTLHSRELWVKQAKVVRLGEQPYKIVKARPKYDRMSGKFLSDLPLELFGPWQVEEYIPPVAVDGKVPRNPYGNVELFKACMLPKGTVHLQLPGLNRVARKLQIDCAPAMIGFDYHCGGSHPMFDGFVVCEEFQDVLVDAWNREQEEAVRREQEKRDKRVYGNWRRLIKGLLIRERLKARYSFEDEQLPSGSKNKRTKKLKTSSKKPKMESKEDSDCETE